VHAAGFIDYSCRRVHDATTFLPGMGGGKYQLKGASLFDTEYIDPAMLKGPDTTAMGNFINNSTFRAMKYTQNEPSPHHPEWAVSSYGREAAANFHPGAFFKTPRTRLDASFDWPGAQQGAWLSARRERFG
jgi:hypothetical protein